MGYISEHIRHLKRGRCYNIQGKNILTIGGADSVDKFRRIEGLSWWKEEVITDEDIERIDNSKKFDYVLTHTCPTSVFNMYKMDLCTLGNIVDNDNPDYKVCNNQLEKVLNFIDFDKWIFGHMHIDKDLDEHFTCLYNTFKEIL